MTWDVTVTDTLAASYLTSTSTVAEGAAKGAASRKEAKYQMLARTQLLSHWRLKRWVQCKMHNIFNELGRHLTTISGDLRETAYLHQRLSIAQRFNGICFHGSFSQ
jgi:hypothetical protein